MKIFILLGALTLIASMARADYSEYIELPTCTTTGSFGIGNGDVVYQSLPIQYDGTFVPIMEWNITKFLGGVSLTIPFAAGIATSVSARHPADDYWNASGGIISPQVVKAGYFRLVMPSVATWVVVRINFENQTTTISSQSGGASLDLQTWHAPAASTPSGAYAFWDGWKNGTLHSSEVYSHATLTPCSGGNSNTFVEYAPLGMQIATNEPGERVNVFVNDSGSLPSVPQNLTAVPGDHSIFLDWDPPLSSGSSPLEGYKIYRQDTIAMTPVVLATLNATEYLDKPLVCSGPGFNYSISAFNAVGEGPATSWSGFKFPLCRSGTLFGGDSAQIYGPGGKAGLAQTLGISPDAAGYFWGFLLLLAFAMVGGILGNMAGNMIIGGIIGSAIGLALTTMWGMIPWWATLFIVMASAATFLILSRRQEAI